MPYKTKVVGVNKETAESPIQGMRKVFTELDEVKSGEMVMGSIGLIKKEEPKSEEILTPDDEEKKKVLNGFLAKTIIPIVNSPKKPSPEVDKQILQNKLDRMTLEELLRFIPKKLNFMKVEPETLSAEFKIEINKRYKNLSP